MSTVLDFSLAIVPVFTAAAGALLAGHRLSEIFTVAKVKFEGALRIITSVDLFIAFDGITKLTSASAQQEVTPAVSQTPLPSAITTALQASALGKPSSCN
jgi:putative Ca2+/H+ antiporter (TMEM165/GDT1 family)